VRPRPIAATPTPGDTPPAPAPPRAGPALPQRRAAAEVGVLSRPASLDREEAITLRAELAALRAAHGRLAADYRVLNEEVLPRKLAELAALRPEEPAAGEQTLAQVKAALQGMAEATQRQRAESATAEQRHAAAVAASGADAAGLRAEVAARDETIAALRGRLERAAMEEGELGDRQRELEIGLRHKDAERTALAECGEGLRDHLAELQRQIVAQAARLAFLAAQPGLGWAADPAELDARRLAADGSSEPESDPAAEAEVEPGGGGVAAAAAVEVDAGGVGVDSFVKLGLLGKGAVGRCYLVKKKGSNTLYAMKTLSKLEMTRTRKKGRRVMTEQAVLSTVRHPLIISLYWAFQSADWLYYILEYCPGGEFFQLMKKQPHGRLQVRA
jgi:hypothetical protein